MKRRLMNKFGIIRALVLIMAVMVETGCETNPYTKRSQLLLTSVSEENDLGAKAYSQILSDPKVNMSQDPKETDPVNRVAQRIIAAAKQDKYQELANRFSWEVTVIKDDTMLNAFALPGGKIAVYTGIFPMAKNESGLAAIMGHEVIHALARHGAERMSQGQLTNIGLTVVEAALGVGGTSAGLTQAAMAALGAGANVGLILPFSRAHESEADYVGLLLAAQAGYDPREAVRVWERMEQASQGQPPEFMSTHPAHGTRIKQLQEWMPEALALYNPPAGLTPVELPKVGTQ